MLRVVLAAVLILAPSAAQAAPKVHRPHQLGKEAQIRPSSRATLTGRLARYETYGSPLSSVCEIVVNTDPNLSSQLFPDNDQVLWYAAFNRAQWPDLCLGWMRPGMKVVITGRQFRVPLAPYVVVIGETFDWIR